MDRRTFLACTAACAAAGLPACGRQPQGRIAAGNIADLAAGELVPIEGERVAIGLDEDGLYALSTVCTHMSCDMARRGSVGFDELVCDCHGSRFDGRGRVLEGPARDPLPHFEVLLGQDGEILIDADVVVDAGDRTPVA